MSAELEVSPQNLLKLPAQIDALPSHEKNNYYINGGLLNLNKSRHLRRLESNEQYSQELVQQLSERVIGQEDACRIVARRALLAGAGMQDPKRPLSAIFELGPTGVGKTEMAHALANLVFEDPYSDRLKIINMGEFTDATDVRRFLGPPPSYIGSDDPVVISHDWLHQVIKQENEEESGEDKPEFAGSIIVFDEFEKAHPNVAKIFLSILDKGKLIARNKYKGDQPLDFTKSHLIFTSNIGADEMQHAASGTMTIGFGKENKSNDVVISGKQALQRHFRFMPEFVGRLSDIIVFKPLEAEHYKSILHKTIDERNKMIKEKFQDGSPVEFGVTSEFSRYILSKIDSRSGARQMQRLLEVEMFEKAVDILLEHDLSGCSLFADFEDGEVTFYSDTPQTL